MSQSTKDIEMDYATKAIHAGQDHNQWSNLEIIPPVVTSITYYEPNATKPKGFNYGRDGNPTRSSLEKCLSTLDDAKYCLALPSGCAATTTVLNLLKTGQHIIASLELYGGTRTLFLQHCNQFDIEIDFVDTTDTLSVKKAIKSNTKLIWIETPSNPCLKVSDLSAISELAHSNTNQEILVVVDNTVLTSYFQKPLALGADIVMYSLTKYMNGHNDVLMGALCLNDEKLYKKLDYIQVKYGLIPSPFDCYLVNRGLKTLPLRMDRHSENGLAIAKYLETHPNVVKVHHPGLLSHPHYELSKKQSTGYSGLLSVQLKGTINESKKFVENLNIFLSSASFGCCGSSAVLPAFSSHVNVPIDVRNKLEVFDTTVRISVGLENINDLIRDLEQAFKSTYLICYSE